MGPVETARAWTSNKDIFNGTIGGLISTALLTAPLYAARLTRLFLRHIKLGFLARLLGMVFGWIVVGYLLSPIIAPSWLFFGLAAVLMGSILWIANPFYRLGIVDAHTRTVDGINFKTSLNLAQSSIDFLGIGADKLTKLAEFEAAMLRCGGSGNVVRLLLSPPDNPILERHAKRNGVDASAYKEKVLESLRRVAKLRAQHDLAIEVRFYPAANMKDLQQFRLMFIDGSICLAGWTVWGKHIGTENPQLVLKERRRVHPDVTAYKAFHDHFEALWDDSDTTHVDLSHYI
jgi:hypothetical protein